MLRAGDVLQKAGLGPMLVLLRLLVPYLGAWKLRTIRHLSTMSSKKVNSPQFSKLLTPQLLQLEKLFKSRGYEFRLVGGVVRDLLLGQGPKDVDIGTDCTPEDMIEMFKKERVRYFLTGMKHGTLTVMMGGVSYEVYTYMRVM